MRRKFTRRVAPYVIAELASAKRVRSVGDTQQEFVHLERAHVIGQETECMAILQQVAAIRGAVSGLMTEVLEGHIREHLGAEGIPPEQRSEELGQVVAVLRSYLK